MNERVWYLCYLYSIIWRWFHKIDFYWKIIEFIFRIHDFLSRNGWIAWKFVSNGYLQSVGAKIGAWFAIYKVWERKLELDLLFTKCGSENWSLIGYLQSVGAKTGAWLAIYKVWERKLELDWLFTKCGSENWSLIGYLQSVGAKMQMHFEYDGQLPGVRFLFQWFFIGRLRERG